MKKKLRTVIIVSVCIIAVIAIAVIAIMNGNQNAPEDPINDMVTALNDLDFDAYVNTLHPALRNDARNGMTNEKKSAYMHTLRMALLEGYPENTTIQITHWENYDLDSSDIISIENDYKDMGYNINVEEAKIYYYYSVMLENGEPEGLDSIIVVRSNGRWYLLA